MILAIILKRPLVNVKFLIEGLRESTTLRALQKWELPYRNTLNTGLLYGNVFD